MSKEAPQTGGSETESSCPQLSSVSSDLAKRFLVVEPLRRLSSGYLYLAQDRQASDSECSDAGLLRVIRFPEGFEASGYERMFRQLQRQSRLPKTSALALPHACGRFEDGVWLFRHHHQGSTLAQRLGRDGAQPVELALSIAGQTAAGLEHLHRSGLLHRDLRPSRVLLRPTENDTEPSVILLGAGVAAPVDPEAYPGLLGSAEYLAPELIAGRLPSVRSDLYSLGCMLHEMLSGAPPYRGDRVADVLEAQCEREPPALEHPLPNGVGKLLEGLLAKDPKHRPFSARQVVRVLAPYMPKGAARSSESTPGSASPSAQAAEARRPAAQTGFASAGHLAQPSSGPERPTADTQELTQRDLLAGVEPPPAPGASRRRTRTETLDPDELEPLGPGEPKTGARATQRHLREDLVPVSKAPEAAERQTQPFEESEPPAQLRSRDAGSTPRNQPDVAAESDVPGVPKAAGTSKATPEELDAAAGKADPWAQLEAPPQEPAPGESGVTQAAAEQAVQAGEPDAAEGQADPWARLEAPPQEPPRVAAPAGEAAGPRSVAVLPKRAWIVAGAGAVLLVLVLVALGGSPDEAAPPQSPDSGQVGAEQIDSEREVSPGHDQPFVDPLAETDEVAQGASSSTRETTAREQRGQGSPGADPPHQAPAKTETVQSSGSPPDEPARREPTAAPTVEGLAAAAPAAAGARAEAGAASSGREPTASRRVHQAPRGRVRREPRLTERRRRRGPGRGAAQRERVTRKKVAAGHRSKSAAFERSDRGARAGRRVDRGSSPATGAGQGTRNATELRDAARKHFRARRYAQAAAGYRSAIAQAPRHAGSYAGLAASELAQGHAAAAVRAYRRAIALSPRVSGFHAALGRAYLAADERGHAERSYRKAVELDPRNTAAREALRKLGR
ncbi:MAG: protein kinase [Proteobacteria bacterium]|nr:protein kinase [Pseudomonadota bacterium]